MGCAEILKNVMAVALEAIDEERRKTEKRLADLESLVKAWGERVRVLEEEKAGSGDDLSWMFEHDQFLKRGGG